MFHKVASFANPIHNFHKSESHPPSHFRQCPIGRQPSAGVILLVETKLGYAQFRSPTDYFTYIVCNYCTYGLGLYAYITLCRRFK